MIARNVKQPEAENNRTMSQTHIYLNCLQLFLPGCAQPCRRSSFNNPSPRQPCHHTVHALIKKSVVRPCRAVRLLLCGLKRQAQLVMPKTLRSQEARDQYTLSAGELEGPRSSSSSSSELWAQPGCAAPAVWTQAPSPTGQTQNTEKPRSKRPTHVVSWRASEQGPHSSSSSGLWGPARVCSSSCVDSSASSSSILRKACTRACC